ncbi:MULTISPECIES: hypothetical protein [unclassified Imperialibacter]|uniref:hypothetical protein n=1 Tax=unclassified Imperialibacter TaxID=2629706 RepID=UPI001250DB07|nr:MULTISPECIES: hypothetical protein [unclassified Imperialibacter]CAD5252693.1 hypothetical protein IMPERIA89_170073 [Imperialibacter sp. 89]CAD5260824.1 hypothetical protein IMPERIA75_260073 [Imperialibacter sp. 75]VVT03926.1 hypothetical protein IMPR6_140100 [Imperialibacter sp. EC-SDR9]
MNSTATLFALAIVSFALVSCSEEPKGPVDNRPVIKFQGTVVDSNTGDPVSGLEIKYYSELGCSAILKDITTESGNDGGFSISYRKDIDSLITVSQLVDVDTSHIYHGINLYEPYFLVTKRTQGPREIILSRDGNLRPNQETVLIQVVKAGVLEFEFEYQEFKHPKSIMEISIYLKSAPDEPYQQRYYYSDGEFTDTDGLPDVIATLPADQPLIIRWQAKEGVDFAFPENFEVVSEGEEELTLVFEETRAIATLNF